MFVVKDTENEVNFMFYFPLHDDLRAELFLKMSSIWTYHRFGLGNDQSPKLCFRKGRFFLADSFTVCGIIYAFLYNYCIKVCFTVAPF